MEALVCNSMQKYCEIIKWDWIWDLFYVDKILEFFDLPPPFVDILFSKIAPLGCLRRIRMPPKGLMETFENLQFRSSYSTLAGRLQVLVKTMGFLDLLLNMDLPPPNADVGFFSLANVCISNCTVASE